MSADGENSPQSTHPSHDMQYKASDVMNRMCMTCTACVCHDAETLALPCRQAKEKKMKSNVDVTRLLEPCALVESYIRSKLEKTDKDPEFSVYIVWFCYILGGWKALISTTLPDGMYYEVTHSAVRRETYLDAYKKFDNVKFTDQD